jgi:hypothetical protein
MIRAESAILHEILSSMELKLENEDSFLTILIDLTMYYFDFWQYIEVITVKEDASASFIDHAPSDESRESI